MFAKMFHVKIGLPIHAAFFVIFCLQQKQNNYQIDFSDHSSNDSMSFDWNLSSDEENGFDDWANVNLQASLKTTGLEDNDNANSNNNDGDSDSSSDYENKENNKN